MKKHEPWSLEENDVAVLEHSNDDSNRVEAALLELPPEDREIVTLKHIEGLTYDELSERLEIPVGTVMSRLYRARCCLREQLERSDETRDLWKYAHILSCSIFFKSVLGSSTAPSPESDT